MCSIFSCWYTIHFATNLVISFLILFHQCRSLRSWYNFVQLGWTFTMIEGRKLKSCLTIHLYQENTNSLGSSTYYHHRSQSSSPSAYPHYPLFSSRAGLIPISSLFQNQVMIMPPIAQTHHYSQTPKDELQGQPNGEYLLQILTYTYLYVKYFPLTTY